MSLDQRRAEWIIALRDEANEWPADIRPRSGNRSILTHPGRIGVAELEHLHRNTPTLVLAALNVPASEDRDVLWRVQWGLYVATTDTRANTADIAALKIVSRLLKWLPRGNTECARKPERIKANNLYSLRVHKRGGVLWGITWDQVMDLSQDNSATLANLNTIHSLIEEGADPDNEPDQQSHITGLNPEE